MKKKLAICAALIFLSACTLKPAGTTAVRPAGKASVDQSLPSAVDSVVRENIPPELSSALDDIVDVMKESGLLFAEKARQQ